MRNRDNRYGSSYGPQQAKSVGVTSYHYHSNPRPPNREPKKRGMESISFVCPVLIDGIPPRLTRKETGAVNAYREWVSQAISYPYITSLSFFCAGHTLIPVSKAYARSLLGKPGWDNFLYQLTPRQTLVLQITTQVEEEQLNRSIKDTYYRVLVDDIGMMDAYAGINQKIGFYEAISGMRIGGPHWGAVIKSSRQSITSSLANSWWNTTKYRSMIMKVVTAKDTGGEVVILGVYSDEIDLGFLLKEWIDEKVNRFLSAHFPNFVKNGCLEVRFKNMVSVKLDSVGPIGNEGTSYFTVTLECSGLSSSLGDITITLAPVGAPIREVING